ncbi:MAG: hypothetical protein K2G10_03325, partial [Alistipes sp.]|nr:hypothetical protein [Alistipes sp.]
MATVFTRSFMMFPNITSNDQLKISVKSDGHNISLWNTPSKDLVGGTVLRFPINIDKDFQRGVAGDDLAYVATENQANPFIYYGTANCYLMVGTGSGSANIDVTPYVANRFYEQQTQEAGTALPQSAAVIWKESTMGTITVGNIITAQKRFNVTVNNGYGNALIGIYSGANGTGNLLWSYHIWKTEDDPQTTIPYNVTNSGSYAVMPMALGATKKSTKASAAGDKVKSCGLYYQWGRKDPLGRPNALPASGNSYVTVQDKNGTAFAADYWTNANVKELSDNAANNGILVGVNQTADGFELDRYMIDYAVKNPTVFIKVPNGTYNNDWAGVTNNNLWANPEGYNYPEQSQLRGRSVFDPCPTGYHVAPKDLWINFSQTRANTTVPAEFNVSNYVDNTSISTDKGYSFYINNWKTGDEDFYPASGYRNYTSGALTAVGAYGFCWSSAPHTSTAAGGMAFTATLV